MSKNDIHLLDLPNELLLIILDKVGNVNALYSLLDVINKRFNSLLEDNVFTNTLNFTQTSLFDHINSSVGDRIIDRFCFNILPRIDVNVKQLTLKSTSMTRILLAGSYPNLTSLKLFHFEENIAFSYFTDNSMFRHIFKYQIRKLILENDDENCDSDNILLKDYTADVYAPILNFFENLNHLSIVPSCSVDYMPLSICDFPSTTFSSSILRELCIDVDNFDDCLCLLDGRLKQLNTFIVRIDHIDNHSSIVHKIKDDLSNLIYFSLKCYDETSAYDSRVLPLLHRMTNLNKLTLYLRVNHREKFIDGTHLHKQIVMHMQQLHRFIFYISTEIEIDDSVDRLSSNDIEQTFTNFGYDQIACNVNYYSQFEAICHVFSLPFIFDRLKDFSTNFPPVIYDHVTDLEIFALIPFSDAFLVRMAHAFPSLEDLSIKTNQSLLSDIGPDSPKTINSIAIRKYLNVSIIITSFRNNYYIEPNN